MGLLEVLQLVQPNGLIDLKIIYIKVLNMFDKKLNSKSRKMFDLNVKDLVIINNERFNKWGLQIQGSCVHTV